MPLCLPMAAIHVRGSYLSLPRPLYPAAKSAKVPQKGTETNNVQRMIHVMFLLAFSLPFNPTHSAVPRELALSVAGAQQQQQYR